MSRIFGRAPFIARPLPAMQLAVSHIPLAAPVLSQVAAALRKTTESLVRELVDPTNQAPSWTDFEWRIARAVAGMQGVSSLLQAGLEGPRQLASISRRAAASIYFAAPGDQTAAGGNRLAGASRGRGYRGAERCGAV